MKQLILLFTFCLVLVINTIAQKTYKYPDAPRDSVFDTYFNDTIYDPYQWMENPNDIRLEEWLSSQKKITKKRGSQHTQVWTLRSQVVSMYYDTNIEDKDGYIEEKSKEKSKYLFKYEYKGYRRSGDLMYRKRESSNYITLVKSKKFEVDKKDNVDITDNVVNEDIHKIAVVISHSGSDWHEAYFFDLKTGEQLADTLKFLRNHSDVIWHEDGVYYDRYDEPQKGRELMDLAKGQKLCYHKLGTNQSEDKILYYNPDTSGVYDFTYYKDNNRLYFYHYYNSRGTIYKALSYSDLNDDNTIFLRNYLIYPHSDSIYMKIEENIGDSVIIRTNYNAPNGKVIIANVNKKNDLHKLIPEFDIPLREINRLGKDKLACIYRNGGQFLSLIFDLQGNHIKTVDFPIGEKVKYLYEYDFDAEYTDFCVSSFYHPDLWYQLSLKDLTFKSATITNVPYNPNELETRYVLYKSKDGTEIPMYITCLKKTELNGKNPTLIYAYGGYGTTIEPRFNEFQALFILHGGVLAVPNIRGGGAEGSRWSRAGQGLNKQNTIDDFIAATEYLIKEKYTNPEKIVINGASHGGFLVGAAGVLRPDLYKAVIAEAGVFDMLRFEKFTVGSKRTNLNEFGSVKTELGYQSKKSYSPLHNIKDHVKYPDVLLMTGDNDDRVNPLHSFKFLATLQEKGSPQSFYHLYLLPGAGHGGALTPEDWIEYNLYKYYFLFDQLDIKFW